MKALPSLGAMVLGLWIVGAARGLSAAEPPPAPILMTTTATVLPVADAASRGEGTSPELPPPRQAALETVGMTPAQEARYRALTKELRCPLCQNQSISDSDAPISADLRDQVRARILTGASDDDIRTFVTDRFGEFALYRPRLGGITLWLWLAPLALLVSGGAMVLVRLNAGRARPDEAADGAPWQPPATAGEATPDARPGAGPTDSRLARLLSEEGAMPGSPPPSPSSPRTPA